MSGWTWYSRTTAAALALCAGVAHAETLADALADAYRNNPTLNAQRAELRVVDENYIQAGAPYRLQASLGSTAEFANYRSPASSFGGSSGISSDLATVGLSASQILFNGGRTAAALSAADAEVLSARARLREVENQVLYSVADAYASVIRDADIVAIRARSVTAFAGAANQAGARRNAGDLTRTDTSQAEAQAAIARVALSQAEAQLQFSRGRFAQIVGRAPGELEPPPILAGLPTTIDESYRIAESESPSLRRSLLDARAARARVQAARAEANPVVSLNGTAGYTGPANLNTSDYRRDLIGRVTVSLPILSGGLVASRRRQAIADVDRLGNVIEESRRSVDLDVLQAWNQAVAAEQQLANGEAAIRAASVSSVGSSREFLEGFRSTFEVLNEQQRLLDAEVVVAQARYARYVGMAGLLATLGRMEIARIAPNVPRYDAASEAQARRNRTLGPFDPLLVPIDRLQLPSAASKPVPPLPVAADPSLAPATTTIPADAPLSTAMPASQPVCEGGPTC